MLTLTLHSLEDTAHFARALAEALAAAPNAAPNAAPDAVPNTALAAPLPAHPSVRALLLRGELGSGKTTFTRALVHALPGGDRAEVASPSFTLCHTYPTAPPVLHCDLYRTPAALPEEVWEGLDNAQVLTIIEWAEHLPPAALPEEYLDIALETCQINRLVRVTPHGAASRGLVAALQYNLRMTL